MVILVKNNKGGVGKSLISLWLAHGLTLQDKKVLILTSDTQDNIPTFCGKYKESKELKRGLEMWLKEGEGDILELRKNLYYIPLRQVAINEAQSLRMSTFVEEMKKRVDYIIIDASPVLTLDDVFVELADSVIAPTFLDEVTTQGLTQLINKVGLRKIKAIVPNRCHSNKHERKVYELLKNSIGTQTLITEPLKHSYVVAGLVLANKTIWETSMRAADPIKNIFQQVIEVVK
jgi:chromosome partitioning protein